MMIYLFNVSQLYSIHLFLKATFEEVDYNKRTFCNNGEKNEILDSSIAFLRSNILKHIAIKM